MRRRVQLVLLGAAALSVNIAFADNTSGDSQATEVEPPAPIDEIIVVGEKIGRTLWQTPSGTVVMGREVDTAYNRRLEDAIKFIPNVLADPASSNLPAVRGVDGSSNLHVNSSFMTGSQPRVNTLVDGVARPFKLSSISSLSSVWDVEAVEVARGPQSTISGRNSFGGAVRVITRDPVYEPEFAARAGYYNEPGTLEGAFMANLPVVEDQVALRFTAEVADGESYVEITGGSPAPWVDPDVASRDDIDDEEFERYRGKLLLTPSALPDTKFLLSIDRTETWRAHQPKADDALADDLIDSTFGDGNWIDDNEQTVFSAQLFQGLGETTELEVRVSYLDNTAEMPPGILSFFDLTYETETISTEAMLRFEELGFVDKGVVGVAYERQEDDGINRPAPFFFTMDGEAETYGIFGEIEAGLGGDFTAIVGGRFQSDERDRSMNSTALSGNPRGDALEVSEDAFIPKLGVRYDGADKYVAGYTYSEGYRPAGIDFHFFTDDFPTSTFDSERIKNHEIWVRSTPTDRVSLDGSLFYYTMDDLQIRGATSDSDCANFPSPCLTGNIPEAEGYGMELAAQFDINDAWTISGGLGLLDTEITDAGSDVPQYQGQELNQAPDVTANLGISWVSPLGFDAQARVRHVGSFLKNLDAEADREQIDDYTLVDLNAGYDAEIGGANLRIDAFVENLTDKRYVLLGTSHSGSKDAAGRPRTYGIAVTTRF